MIDTSDALVNEFQQLYYDQTGKTIGFVKAKESAILAVEIYSILLGIAEN